MLRTLRPHALRASVPVFQSTRMSSTGASTSAEPPRKKKPSPYRIPKLDAFQESFSPLSAAGWRLAATSSSAAHPAEGTATVSDPLELEAKRLVQSYHFSDYAKLLEMMNELGRLVQDQDVSSPLTTELTGSTIPPLSRGRVAISQTKRRDTPSASPCSLTRPCPRSERNSSAGSSQA